MAKKNITKAFEKLHYLTRRYRNVNSPVFWIFLDSERIKDYESFISAIPAKTSVGVIYRTKNIKGRYCTAKMLFRLCKRKKFPFIIADDPNLALSLGAYGVHNSKKTRFVKKYRKLHYSSSMHGFNDKRRINELCTELVFISPLFKTTSSKVKKPLGLNFLGILAKFINCNCAVIGGINFENVRLLRGRKISTLGGLTYVSKLLESHKC